MHLSFSHITNTVSCSSEIEVAGSCIDYCIERSLVDHVIDRATL